MRAVLDKKNREKWIRFIYRSKMNWASHFAGFDVRYLTVTMIDKERGAHLTSHTNRKLMNIRGRCVDSELPLHPGNEHDPFPT